MLIVIRKRVHARVGAHVRHNLPGVKHRRGSGRHQKLGGHRVTLGCA